MVQKTDDRICSLPCVECLINQVVDLPWDTLTTHPKDCTLASCLKVHRPRLEGVVRVVHLLGEVKRIVHTCRPTFGWYNRANRGRQEDVISGEILPYVILAVLHHSTEV